MPEHLTHFFLTSTLCLSGKKVVIWLFGGILEWTDDHTFTASARFRGALVLAQVLAQQAVRS